MLKKIENTVNINPNDSVIVLSGHNWHGGIIGIIAARLKDKYNKPTIIISVEKGLGKASARSILGFDIGTVIINAVQNNILKKGGGHKMAGGFTIEENKIQDFKKFITKKFLKIKKNLNKTDTLFFDSKIIIG